MARGRAKLLRKQAQKKARQAQRKHQALGRLSGKPQSNAVKNERRRLERGVVKLQAKAASVAAKIAEAQPALALASQRGFPECAYNIVKVVPGSSKACFDTYGGKEILCSSCPPFGQDCRGPANLLSFGWSPGNPKTAPCTLQLAKFGEKCAPCVGNVRTHETVLGNA